MKNLNSLFILLVSGLVIMASTQAIAQKKMKKDMTATKMADLKWEQEKDAPPGVMGADVWGNRHTGAYGGYSKFPAGAKFPLHFHTNDFKGIVVSGTIASIGEDGKKFEGGPGDYFSFSAGNRHTTEVGPEGAILFEWSTEKAVVKMVEEKTMEKK